MDEVTFVKTQFCKEQWKKLILECQSSGMKVEDWCASHDVTKHAYYYWLHKIREEACENLPAKQEQAKSFKKYQSTSFKNTGYRDGANHPMMFFRINQYRRYHNEFSSRLS